MSAESLYEQIGGEQKVKSLCGHFYLEMTINPDLRELRDLHPASLQQAEQKLFEFLSGWLGGPALFTERHGPPMLRARHLPFRITEKGAHQWIQCMEIASQRAELPEPQAGQILKALQRLAMHMVNTPEH